MRDYISPNTTRVEQARPQKCLEWTRFFEGTGGAGPGLIARHATLRGGALSGQLLCCDAAEEPVDVLCTRGTALSEDRLSPRHRRSGLVGRVLESGHTAGEPVVPERKSPPAPVGAPVLAKLLRPRIREAAVAGVNRPCGASVGFFEGRSGPNIRQVAGVAG
jgi:hypothetical protein